MKAKDDAFRVIVLMVCCLFFACIVSEAETIPPVSDVEGELATYRVKNKSKRVSFSYPAGCTLVDDGAIGVFVYLDDRNAVALSIPKHDRSGTEQLADNVSPIPVLELQDNLHVYRKHGADWLTLRLLKYDVDIVELGIDLPNGIGLIVNVEAEYGHTEIYPVLLTILDSIIDAPDFKDWLTNEWIPYVTADG